MGGFTEFALNALRMGAKRGRAPVLSAQRFYPRALERRLAGMTADEFRRAWESAFAAAMSGMAFDTIEDLDREPDVPDGFIERVGEVGEAIAAHAQEQLVEFSRMAIGVPYYPPAIREDVVGTWRETFRVLCKSAEGEAKGRIAAIVSEGKNTGMNRAQVEKAVMAELPSWSKRRAELIARTETAKLNNAATMATYRSAGIEYYRWLATPDERTRPGHAEMNGRICAVGKPDVYYEENPDDPLHPVERDRTSSMYHGDPGTDYQCRCTSVPWDPRIDGRYEVKETPEPEREPTRLERERERADRAEERARKAEEEARELRKRVRELEGRG